MSVALTAALIVGAATLQHESDTDTTYQATKDTVSTTNPKNATTASADTQNLASPISHSSQPPTSAASVAEPKPPPPTVKPSIQFRGDDEGGGDD